MHHGVRDGAAVSTSLLILSLASLCFFVPVCFVVFSLPLSLSLLLASSLPLSFLFLVALSLPLSLLFSFSLTLFLSLSFPVSLSFSFSLPFSLYFSFIFWKISQMKRTRKLKKHSYKGYLM